MSESGPSPETIVARAATTYSSSTVTAKTKRGFCSGTLNRLDTHAFIKWTWEAPTVVVARYVCSYVTTPDP